MWRAFWLVLYSSLAVAAPLLAQNSASTPPPAAADPLPDGAVARFGTVRGQSTGRLVPHTLLYSPDGKLLASADSQTIYLWDAATGRERHQFGNVGAAAPARAGAAAVRVGRGSTIRPHALAFAPDSKTLAAGINNQVRVWDVTTGHGVIDWPAPGSTSMNVSVAYSPDGKRVAGLLPMDTTIRRPTITVWDPTTGEQLKHMPIGEQGTSSSSLTWLTYSPDGRLLAASTYGRPIQIVEAITGLVRAEWDATHLSTRGRLIDDFDFPYSPTTGGVSFSADGKTLFAVTPQGNIAAWDVIAGKEKREFGLVMSGSPLSLSADGKLLAVRGSDSSIRLYEPATGRLRLRVTDAAHTPLNNAFALSPDGTTLATIDRGGSLRFWDAATGRERNPGEGHAGAVTQLAFAPDGKALVSASIERVCAWDVTAHKQQAALDMPVAGPRLRALSPDGRRLAVAGATGSVRVIDVPGGQVLRQLDDITSGLFGLAFTADGGTLAVSEGKVVKLWDLATGTAKRTLDAGAGAVSLIAISADGRRLAAVGGFGSVQVWDADTGRPLWEQTVTAGNRAPVFSPDGRRLAVSGGDGHVRVFDTATGHELARLEDHAGAAPVIVFSPDGQRLVTGGVERQVRVWEVAGARPLQTLSGHMSAVESLAYSPDGKLLASGGADAVVYLWDAVRFGASPDAAAPEPSLTEAQIAKLWDELTDSDAAKAYAAMRTLAASPRTATTWLRTKLKPADATAAAPPGAAEPPPEELRQLRALEVLEWAGTPDARAALEELAKGADGAGQTRAARAALERLKKQ
jgi:WD40 repeat protein